MSRLLAALAELPAGWVLLGAVWGDGDLGSGIRMFQEVD